MPSRQFDLKEWVEGGPGVRLGDGRVFVTDWITLTRETCTLQKCVLPAFLDLVVILVLQGDTEFSTPLHLWELAGNAFPGPSPHLLGQTWFKQGSPGDSCTL